MHAGKRALRHRCMMGVTAPVTEEPAAVLGLRARPRLPFLPQLAPCRPGAYWEKGRPAVNVVGVSPLVVIGLVHSRKDHPSSLRGTGPFCHTPSAEHFGNLDASTQSTLEGGHYKPEASWEELPRAIVGTGPYCPVQRFALASLPQHCGKGCLLYYVRAGHLGS